MWIVLTQASLVAANVHSFCELVVSAVVSQVLSSFVIAAEWRVTVQHVHALVCV